MSPEDPSDVEVEESTDIGCGHEACLCAADDSGYCSDYCAKQEGDAAHDEGCGCGHDDCMRA